MLQTLTTACNALARNDAERLEALCAALPSAIASKDLDAYAEALRVLRRQVLAARSNLIVRQRLLAARASQEGSWAP